MSLKEYQENYLFHFFFFFFNFFLPRVRTGIDNSFQSQAFSSPLFQKGNCILLILVEMLIFYLAQYGMRWLLRSIGI